MIYVWKDNLKRNLDLSKVYQIQQRCNHNLQLKFQEFKIQTNFSFKQFTEKI